MIKVGSLTGGSIGLSLGFDLARSSIDHPQLFQQDVLRLYHLHRTQRRTGPAIDRRGRAYGATLFASLTLVIPVPPPGLFVQTKKTGNKIIAGFTIRSLLPLVTTLSSQFIASTLSGP